MSTVGTMALAGWKGERHGQFFPDELGSKNYIHFSSKKWAGLGQFLPDTINDIALESIKPWDKTYEGASHLVSHLNLENCKKITNASVPYLESVASSLKCLNLRGSSVTEISPFSPLWGVPDLRMNPRQKKNMNDADLESWVKLFEQYHIQPEHLNLQNCTGITDASVPILEKLVLSLKWLNIFDTSINLSPYSPLWWVDTIVAELPELYRVAQPEDYSFELCNYDDEDCDYLAVFKDFDTGLRYLSGNLRGKGIPNTFIVGYKFPNGIVSSGNVAAGSFYGTRGEGVFQELEQAKALYEKWKESPHTTVTPDSGEKKTENSGGEIQSVVTHESVVKSEAST